MQVRRLLTAGIWLATTGAATAMVWTATSVVVADVTDRPPPVVPREEVVQALEEAIPGPEATPPVETPTTTSTSPRRATTTAPPPGASASPAPDPGTTVPPPPPTSTTTTTTTAPATPPSTAPPAPDPTGTFSTTGGVVTATCSGYFIRLVAATPADGYAVEVLDRGPASVDVHFKGRGGDEIRVRLVCFGGRPIRVPDRHEGGSPTSDG